MNLTAQDVIDAAVWELNDSRSNPDTERTWNDPALLGYLNNGIRQIALVRPDMTAKVATIQLAPGALQSLPADGLRLLTVLRNRGSDGKVDGQAITLTERKTLDASQPAWTATRSLVISNYVYDIRFGQSYYVYPGASGTTPVFIEISYAVAPNIQALTDALGVSEICVVPLKHWIKYECLAKERDDASSAEGAKTHYDAFFQELGLKTTSDSSLPVN